MSYEQYDSLFEQQSPQKNSVGTSGFIVALVAFVFCWLPLSNWILWILGLILYLAGIFKMPKGLSIAGLCISFISVILILVIEGLLSSVL